MKKIITGCILIQLLTIEPIIGYSIFRTWLQIDDQPLVYSAVIFAFSAIFQLISYGSIVMAGFKEMKINHGMSL